MPRAASSSRPPWIRMCVALSFMVLLYALTLAARNGLADVYSRPGKNYLQYKRDAGVVLTSTERNAIHTSLRRALNIAPDDPVVLTELGRLYRIQLESDTLNRMEVERLGNLAIGYYERAAMLRPTWPWGWSNMALVRYELYQDGDGAYHNAIIRATHFGPWEESVQRLVAELGIDTWDSLSSGAKQAVLFAIDKALKLQPAKIAAIVDSAQAWQTLCRAAIPIAAVDSNSRKDDLSRLQQHCEEFVPGRAQDLT